MVVVVVWCFDGFLQLVVVVVLFLSGIYALSTVVRT